MAARHLSIQAPSLWTLLELGSNSVTWSIQACVERIPTYDCTGSPTHWTPQDVCERGIPQDPVIAGRHKRGVRMGMGSLSGHGIPEWAGSRGWCGWHPGERNSRAAGDGRSQRQLTTYMYCYYLLLLTTYYLPLTATHYYLPLLTTYYLPLIGAG